jgi:hypothetical protein
MRLKSVFFGMVLFGLQLFYHFESHAQIYPRIDAYIQSGRFDLVMAEAKNELAIKNNPLLNYYLGMSYLESDFSKFKAETYLEKAAISPSANPIFFYDLGRAYHSSGKWELAINSLNEFREKIKNQNEYYQKATELINSCTTALALAKKENVYQTFIFSPYINTSYDDFGILFFPRSESILVSSNRKYNSYQDIISQNDFFPENERNQEINFYQTYPKGETKDTTANWSLTSEQIIPDFKGYPLSVAADGKTFLFLGKQKDRKIDELYLVEYNETKKQWLKPRRLPNQINSGGNFFGATFVNAGRSIIFSSDRAGGYGGYDLYRVDSKQNRWNAPPYNLGKILNSDQDEVSPFMASDNQSLFFSSKRKGTVGGFDVFFSKDSSGTWTFPQNKGLGINSAADEIYYSVKTGSDHAVFSSNRVTEQSIGGYDIYLALNKRPESRIAIVSGKILASYKDQLLPVSISIKPEDSTYTPPHDYIYGPSQDGSYVAFLPQSRNYTFSISVNQKHSYNFRITIEKDTRVYEFSQNIEVKDVTLNNQVIGEILSLSTPFYRAEKMDKTGNSYQAFISRIDNFRKLIEKILEEGDSVGYAQLDNYIDKLKASSPEQREKYYNDIIEEIQNALLDPHISYEVFDKIGTLQGKLTGNQGFWKKNPQDSTVVRFADPFVVGTEILSKVNAQKLNELANFVNEYKQFQIQITKNTAYPEKIPTVENKIRILQDYLSKIVVNGAQKIRIVTVNNPKLKEGELSIELKTMY